MGDVVMVEMTLPTDDGRQRGETINEKLRSATGQDSADGWTESELLATLQTYYEEHEIDTSAVDLGELAKKYRSVPSQQKLSDTLEGKYAKPLDGVQNLERLDSNAPSASVRAGRRSPQ